MLSQVVCVKQDLINASAIIDLLKDGIVVKTRDGAIAIETLKMEGKREMNAQEFLNGVKKEDLINKRFKEE